MKNYIKALKGPIAVFGAGGFIGINLLNQLLRLRKDVFGFSSNPEKNWRFRLAGITQDKLVKLDLLDKLEIEKVVKKYKPKTVFNLAAYGAYSKQKDTSKIYETNFLSTARLIEELKKYSIAAYLHAGSQSEYGFNSAAPSEDGDLLPNSPYAVSKTAVYYLLQYYGKVEKLPTVHFRLYSVYGPWEEPDRLIPVLIENVKKGKLPHFVDPEISRDFVYVDDVVEAMIMVAAQVGNGLKPLLTKQYGEAFNIASGKKTTIKQLAYLAKKLFRIKENPKFSSMKNRGWDLKNWYGNPKKIQKTFGWKAKTNLEEGLRKFYLHEK